MYATRADTPNARRIRNLVLFIKRDQIHVETRRWLAPDVRRTLRPRAPRVEIDEYGTGRILLGSNEELVALTGVPPAEQDALRRRLRAAIEGWPAEPPEAA